MGAGTVAPSSAEDLNGQSPEPQDPHGSDEALRLDTGGQLSFDVGGRPPTSSSLSLTGGKLEIEGQFEKGETVVIRVEAVVNSVGFKDEHDPKTGQVVGCARQQKARIVGVQRLEG